MAKRPTRPAPTDEPGVDTQPDGITLPESSDYLAAITENYGQFVAVSQIHWGNALAFNPGDPVPADRPDLEQLLADGLVVPVEKSS